MQVRMLRAVDGAANPRGSRVRSYAAGEVVDADAPWLAELVAVFVREGWAEPLGRETTALPGAPERAIEPPVRGRKRKG